MAESPYNGYWEIELDRSSQWDWEKNEMGPDLIEREDVRINIDGDIFDWDLWAGRDPAYRLTHTGVIDGGWAPYTCRDIIKSDPTKTNLAGYQVGKPIAHIRLVRISETFIYRISRSIDHKHSYALSTEIIDDGQRIEGYLMDKSGKVIYHRVMKRIS